MSNRRTVVIIIALGVLAILFALHKANDGENSGVQLDENQVETIVKEEVPCKLCLCEESFEHCVSTPALEEAVQIRKEQKVVKNVPSKKKRKFSKKSSEKSVKKVQKEDVVQDEQFVQEEELEQEEQQLVHEKKRKPIIIKTKVHVTFIEED